MSHPESPAHSSQTLLRGNKAEAGRIHIPENIVSP
ncbi:MAG: hypothetical protein UT98_C0003G0078, partial [Candidatus Nomurabacteria bacterium GW2011_GWF2_40_31]